MAIFNREPVTRGTTNHFSVKPVFLKRTYMGKSFDPKIHKNCPVEFIDFNGAVFVNFWVKRFSQVRSLKKQTLEYHFKSHFPSFS